LSEKREDVLPVKPKTWACTSGSGGVRKMYPISPGQYEVMTDQIMCLFILCTANGKGRFSLKKGDTIFGTVAPPPYFSGVMCSAGADTFGFNWVPPLDAEFQVADLGARAARGFQMALDTGIDLMPGLPSIMARMGEQFTRMPIRRLQVKTARAMFRVARAIVRSKLARRPMLPKDLWPVKGMMTGGMDLEAVRDKINYYWGIDPFDFYPQSEFASFIAIPDWRRREMVFQPFGGFLEFIPEAESQANQPISEYQPTTILLNELEAGKSYEVVYTTFYGGVFNRYRPGDMIKLKALSDEKNGIKMPQVLVRGRADRLINLGGFTRLDERTIWIALEDAGIKYENWMARKETVNGNSVVHVYVSTDSGLKKGEAHDRLHEALRKHDASYAELEDMLGWKPLQVTLLPLGVFDKWARERVAAGADPAFVKDQRMQPPEQAVKRILELAGESSH
ncbi:MAG: GH3 auxin-responsive promoter family protein, partial [Chloroflexi bacterium]|nr:GH3 auxin-responsive promoter family protein [Chloroflexota bacterium]